MRIMFNKLFQSSLTDGDEASISMPSKRRIAKLEESVRKLEKEIQKRNEEISKLKYKSVLSDRTFESLFRGIYGRSLHDFAGRHAGERCFVVGNGPSLNKIDISRLRDEITLGANRAFIGFEKWGFSFDYWMVQDRILANQSADEFCDNLPKEMIKFIPYTILRHFDIARLDNVVPFNLDYTQQCSFSNDPSALHEGFTVTVGLLQVAAIMGFTKIVLVGVDHNYQIPKRNVNDDKKWSGEGLSNHFSEDYTNSKNGQVWEMPDIDRMIRAYEAAAVWARKNGIEIVNASPGTHLEAFPKVEFEGLFQS